MRMRLFRNATALLAAAVLAAALGCTSSPTEPSTPPATPKPPAPVTTYTVSVTANPPSITAGSVGSSTITVEVRQTDNGQPPADGMAGTVTPTLCHLHSV